MLLTPFSLLLCSNRDSKMLLSPVPVVMLSTLLQFLQLTPLYRGLQTSIPSVLHHASTQSLHVHQV